MKPAVTAAAVPARLGAAAKLVTDWNTAQETGWYRSNSGSTNGPPGTPSPYLMGQVVNWDGGAAHIVQTVSSLFTQASGLPALEWERRMMSNVWQPWTLKTRGVIARSIGDVNISNTATETFLTELVVPAGVMRLDAGMVRITIFGLVSNSSGGTRSVGLTFSRGASSYTHIWRAVTNSDLAIEAGSAWRPWSVEMVLTHQTSGYVRMNGHVMIGVVATGLTAGWGGTASTYRVVPISGEITGIDWTVDQPFQLWGKWDAGNATCNLMKRIAFMEMLGG